MVMTQSMKFMVALVRPHRLDDVVAAFQREGMRGLVVSEARDYGQTGPTEIYRGAEYTAKFQPMFRIEIAVPSNQIDRITQIIVGAAQMGRPGDGWVRVFDLEQEMPICVESETAPRRAA
jgi:nitrogen regulatory protein P-II 1